MDILKEISAKTGITMDFILNMHVKSNSSYKLSVKAIQCKYQPEIDKIRSEYNSEIERIREERNLELRTLRKEREAIEKSWVEEVCSLAKKIAQNEELNESHLLMAIWKLKSKI